MGSRPARKANPKLDGCAWEHYDDCNIKTLTMTYWSLCRMFAGQRRNTSFSCGRILARWGNSTGRFERIVRLLVKNARLMALFFHCLPYEQMDYG